MDKNNFFVKNKSIITFLILEVVALTAFNFGNVSHIFGIAGALIALLSIPFVLEVEKDKKSFLPFLIPVGLLLVISLWGSLNAFSKGFSTLSNISLAISLPAFFALGFFLRKLKDVKTKTVLLVLGGALAAITLFGLASTLIEYGFFYTVLYKNTPNYYYNGIPYDVTKEMFWLNGFGFTEVFTEYGSMFAIVTASFLPGLLFISPKKERNDFIICASIGGVGLITLLVLPNLKVVIILLVASLFAVLYRFFKNNKKVLKIAGISFVTLLGVAVLIFLIAIINAAIGFKFTGILDRIFVNNRFMNNVTAVMQTIFAKVNGKMVNFFGIMPTVINEEVTWLDCRYFEVQLLKEIGLLGTLLFGAFLVLMGYYIFHYIRKSEDSNSEKSIFITMVLAFFVYESLFNIVSIAPHGESYEAFLRSPMLLVMLFIFGFIFTSPCKKEEQHE